MKIKELKDLIKDLPDDLDVVGIDNVGEYCTVLAYISEDEEGKMLAFSLDQEDIMPSYKRVTQELKYHILSNALSNKRKYVGLDALAETYQAMRKAFHSKTFDEYVEGYRQRGYIVY